MDIFLQVLKDERNLSYFSRNVSAQEFQRLALVEVAAVMDGADWEQNFIDFHCSQAVRILDFAHAAQHIDPSTFERRRHALPYRTGVLAARTVDRRACQSHVGPSKYLVL